MINTLFRMNPIGCFFRSFETTFFHSKLVFLLKNGLRFMTAKRIRKLNKERGIICLLKGSKKDDPKSVILIEQSEEGKSIAILRIQQ